MRTHLEFVSTTFPPYASEAEEVNPGRFGRRLAEFLAEALPRRDFRVAGMNPEDWGWRLDLENTAFPLWIGCGNYEEFENGFLCFIEPSKPFVRRWFSRIDTTETVERLATAMQSVLEESGKADRLRWWSEDEGRI